MPRVFRVRGSDDEPTSVTEFWLEVDSEGNIDLRASSGGEDVDVAWLDRSDGRLYMYTMTKKEASSIGVDLNDNGCMRVVS